MEYWRPKLLSQLQNIYSHKRSYKNYHACSGHASDRHCAFIGPLACLRGPSGLARLREKDPPQPYSWQSTFRAARYAIASR